MSYWNLECRYVSLKIKRSFQSLVHHEAESTKDALLLSPCYLRSRIDTDETVALLSLLKGYETSNTPPTSAWRNAYLPVFPMCCCQEKVVGTAGCRISGAALTQNNPLKDFIETARPSESVFF